MTTEAIVVVILPLCLAITMVGIGLKLTVEDFTRLLKMKTLVFTGLFCQIILLPTLAFFIAKAFSLSPVYSMGLMLLAASPGGATASLMSHFAGGNVALNVTLTAFNALTALVTMPLLVSYSYGHFFDSATSIPVDPTKILQVLFIVTLPMGLAMVFKNKKPKLASRLQKPLNTFSIFVLAFVAIGALIKEREILMSGIVAVGLAVLVFNLLSFAVGYAIPRFMKSSKPDAIAIAMEVGIHNVTLALTIAISPALMNSMAMAAPAALYTVSMYILGTIWIQVLKRG